jgi:hypothetical protein
MPNLCIVCKATKHATTAYSDMVIVQQYISYQDILHALLMKETEIYE